MVNVLQMILTLPFCIESIFHGCKHLLMGTRRYRSGGMVATAARGRIEWMCLRGGGGGGGGGGDGGGASLWQSSSFSLCRFALPFCSRRLPLVRWE